MALPIKLDFLSSVESIKVGVPLKVDFRYPEHHHAIYGKVDLHGSVDFIHPHGLFPIPNFFKFDSLEQFNIINRYTQRLKNFDSELEEKALGCLLTCCFIVPNEDVHSKLFQTMSEIFAIIFQIDDLIDEATLYQECLSTVAIYCCYDNWHTLFSTGNPECYNKIGQQLPVLKAKLQALSEAVHGAKDSVPDICQKLKFANRSLLSYLESMQLLTLDMRDKNDIFSEEALKFVRGVNTGFQMPLDYITAAQGIILLKKVRQSLLFKIFLKAYNLATGLLNDIFGLNKDVRKQTSNDNCILRRVEIEEISLECAFTCAVTLFQNTAHDMQLSGRKLRQAFPDDADLSKYILAAEHMFDGQIYSYLLMFQLNGRYGTIDFKIVAK